MKTRTHTPGPWIARRRKVGKFTFGLQVFVEDRSYTNKSGNSIAIAVPHGSNADANARLIATSPVLLDILQNLMEYWNNGTAVQPGALIVQEARAVIDKATEEGESAD